MNSNFRRNTDFDRSFRTMRRGFFGYLILWVFLIVGWVLNIIDIVRMSDTVGGITEWTVIFWLKIIGIFVAPLGGVMGWFT